MSLILRFLLGALFLLSQASGARMEGCQIGSAATIADFDYGPFGERLAATGNAADLPDFGWQSRYRDPLSGLIYFGHRWYAPELGRWLSRDPSGESGGLNLHGYCHNDPPR